MKIVNRQVDVCVKQEGGCRYNNRSIINEWYDMILGWAAQRQGIIVIGRFGADIAVSEMRLSCGPRVYSASKFETVTQRSSHHQQCLSNPRAPRHFHSINSPPFPVFKARFLLFISHTILLLSSSSSSPTMGINSLVSPFDAIIFGECRPTHASSLSFLFQITLS